MRWSDFINKAKIDIRQHEAEVDATAIWSAIESDVDEINAKRRKRRRFILWFLFAGVSVLCGTLWFGQGYLTQQVEAHMHNDTPMKAAKNIQPTTEKSSAIKNQQNKKTEAEQEQVITPASLEKEKYNSTQQLESDQRTIKQNNNISIARNTKTSSKIMQNHVNKNRLTLGQKNDIDNNKTNLLNSNQSAEVPKMVAKEKTNNSPQTTTSSLPSKNEESNEESILTPKQELPTSISQLSIDDDGIHPMGNNTVQQNVSVPPNDLVNNEVDSNSSDIQPESEQRTKSTLDKSLFTFGLSVTGGLAYSSRKLKAKSIQESEHVNIRENTESLLETSLIGLSLTAAHKSGFELSLGINQTTMTERFDYRSSRITYDTMPGIAYYQIDLQGRQIPIMGDVVSTRTEQINKKVYNRYKILEFPIIAGYRHTKGKWSTGVHLGLLANISLKTSGQIMTPSNEFVDIKKEQEELFVSNLGFGYFAGVSVGYAVSSKLTLNFNPHMRAYSRSFTRSSYGIDQHYKTFGGQIGLSYTIVSGASIR